MNYLYICLFLTGALACQYKGTTYKNGDEWISDKNFKMRCKIDPTGSWRTEISACIAPEETVVPVNGERQIGDEVWECRMSGNGQVTLQPRLSDGASCNGHPYGAEWVEGSFKYRCGERGTRVLIGCATSFGALIRVGETISVKGIDIECKKHSNGTITMEVFGGSLNDKCRDSEGRLLNQGSEWVERSFKYRCGERGTRVFIGCVTLSGALIRVGETISVNGFLMECKKHSNGTITMGVVGRSFSAKCKDNNGRERNQGERWVENNYIEKTCKERGRVVISGCRVGALNCLIPVNGQRDRRKS